MTSRQIGTNALLLDHRRGCGAAGRRSVDLVDRAHSTPLRLDQLPLGKDQLFEITIENATGSPTGRPTGPIVAKGTTAQAL